MTMHVGTIADYIKLILNMMNERRVATEGSAEI